RNYGRLADRLGRDRALFCVVKGDAYGHGAAAVARRLASEGATRFAVAIAEEGIALRRVGILGEILILNFSDPSDAGAHRAYALTPTLYDLDQARAFAQAVRKFEPPLPVHVKLDTGMGRIGFRPAEVPPLANLLRGSPGLAVAGTFSNLASADDPSSTVTARQLETMKACVAALSAAGVPPGIVHVANSAGVLFHDDLGFDGGRPGLALYGVSPSEAGDGGAGLEPAMTLETAVMSVKDVPEGTALGYGGRFVTARPSTIAALPIGYHDGFRRSFSGRVRVLLRGSELPVVGAVSMDLTLVDATGVGARPGQRVVCLGSDGPARVTAWDLARASGTVPYEVLCGIGSRVPRVYAG
ncbi:MAG: alanine racemase, partial [Acidobacteriota bacterium]